MIAVMRDVMLALLFASALAGCAAAKPDSPEACALVRRGAFQLTFKRVVGTVPVTVDGITATMLFDTGASGVVVARSAAERLKLLGNGNIRIQSHALGGDSQAFPAGVGRIDVGGAAMVNQHVIVLPFDLRGFSDPSPEGLLGMDFLSNFDIEVDLRSGAGALYQARNCPSARPGWAEASTILTMPQESGSGKLMVETELDGRKLVALLDTGAESSMVSKVTARRLGITDEVLARDRAIVGHGIAEKDAELRLHRFASLRFGAEEIRSPVLAVGDLPSAAEDMLLGMNYLRGRKLWISPSSRRVFLSAPVRP